MGETTYSFDIGLITDPAKLRKVDLAPMDDLSALYSVIQEMGRICEQHCGAGLSAVQVGVPWCLSIVNTGNKLYRAFVNCTYKPDRKNGKAYSDEGCLSLPGQLYRVERWRKVRVEGWEFDIDKENEEPQLKKLSELVYINADNQLGAVIQHELDHQRGILVSDHGQALKQKERPARITMQSLRNKVLNPR